MYKWPRGCSSGAFGLCPVNEENKFRGTAALREAGSRCLLGRDASGILAVVGETGQKLPVGLEAEQL